MAYHEEAKILKRFKGQPEWLLEGAYWKAVAELLKDEKFAELTHPLSYLKKRVKDRVTDAIRKDVRARRVYAEFIGAKVQWERGLEYRHFGKIVRATDDANWAMKHADDPGVTETYGYIDFVKWLGRQNKVDAEVLLQKSTTDTTEVELGAQFGRDRLWVRRVYARMCKTLRHETGLSPDDIEGMVAEAMRRNGPVYPHSVVRATLGIGREAMGFPREEKDEAHAVDTHIRHVFSPE